MEERDGWLGIHYAARWGIIIIITTTIEITIIITSIKVICRC